MPRKRMIDLRIRKPLDQLKVSTTGFSFAFLNSVSKHAPQKKYSSRFYETEWKLNNGATIYTSWNRYKREGYITLNPGEFSSWKAVCQFLKRVSGVSELSKLRVIEYHAKVDLVGVRTDQIIREINPLWFREGFTYSDSTNFFDGFSERKTLKRETEKKGRVGSP